jgi:hypothetical protein
MSAENRVCLCGYGWGMQGNETVTDGVAIYWCVQGGDGT